MYPYAEFLIDFERKHRGMTHRNRPENTRAAVIVETRADFFLPKVIRNVMYFLGPGWNLRVLCGPQAHGYLGAALGGWEVTVTNLPELGRRLPTDHYNRILTSPAFWNHMPEEKVLIFQTDSLLCGPSVGQFLHYDYIGAPCGRFDEQYVANGGLSLRTRRVMLACLARVPAAPGEPEDVYFSRAVRQIGGAMADFETACRFSVESLYTAHPFGVHGTDKYFHDLASAEKITGAIPY